MRADLLHAQASVDWPVSQFPSLESRIIAWLHLNLEVVVKNPDPDIPYDLVVVIEKEPLPFAFHVEAGAYINTIRSSLDVLASALYARNRMSENAEAHFPIFRSWVDFIDPVEGLEGKKWLSPAERAVIKTLNPYQGGNELLWSLHQLDIMRKHRRLLRVEPTPGFFRVVGPAVEPLQTGWMRTNNQTVLARIAKGASQPQVTRAFTVTLDEPGIAVRKPLIEALYEFADLAESMIKLFDI
jgi:hypothetical protein